MKCDIYLAKRLADCRGCDGNYTSLTLDKITSITRRAPPRGKTKPQAVLVGERHGEQSPCLRWHISVRRNIQHPLLPSLGPGTQHLADTTVRIFKTKETCTTFPQLGTSSDSTLSRRSPCLHSLIFSPLTLL